VDVLFLQRLSKLEHLDILNLEISADAERAPPVSFPHLMYMGGSPDQIARFIPGSAVRVLVVKCDILPRHRWTELMACLKHSTVPIEYFKCGPEALQTDMILSIPDYLPDICVLNLSQILNDSPVCRCWHFFADLLT
jgi:hypothetical protein